MTEGEKPDLIWDSGTGYDLFTSLFVIHNPGDFGLRGSWAAGVRSRLPSDIREMLQDTMLHFGTPLHWVYSLPAPKDGLAVLKALDQVPSREVLPRLVACDCGEGSWDQVYRKVWEKGAWSDEDMADLIRIANAEQKKGWLINKKRLTTWLEWWTRPEEYGDLFKVGISEYYESFYREEERRIAPDLEGGFQRAQKLAESLSRKDLFEELTQGISGEHWLQYDSVILIPSFWSSPLVFHADIEEGKAIMSFGARPADASLVPGETVPDTLSVALPTLADHTRLKILKLLREKALTQTEIAKKLRLRTPTISHHIKNLRAAGLLRFEKTDQEQIRFSVRQSRVREVCRTIKDFLSIED